MERFLQYSLERDRAIRIIYMEDGARLRQVTAVVRALKGDEVSLYIVRPPRDVTVKLADILSCDYRKGDEGGE